MQVLSTIPVLFNYSCENIQDAVEISRELNDHISSICRQYPTRFIGLGTIPLQAPNLAIDELRRCVNELGLKGVQIGTHVNDWNLDDEELDQFWCETEKLDACVFIHPWDMPVGKRHDAYWMPWLCGYELIFLKNKIFILLKCLECLLKLHQLYVQFRWVEF
jgi:aminocarboxymuconate-semialdehyde decarboxylase